MLHLFEIPNWINYLVMSCITLAALLWGGWRGQAVALAQQGYFAFTYNICDIHVCPMWPLQGQWPWLATLHPVIGDGTVPLVCLVCVWRADRYWTMWVAAFALLSVICDLMWFLPQSRLGRSRRPASSGAIR